MSDGLTAGTPVVSICTDGTDGTPGVVETNHDLTDDLLVRWHDDDGRERITLAKPEWLRVRDD